MTASAKILGESEGPDPAVYQAFQKDTLQEVLLVYFRVLKLERNAALIHVVLEGLAAVGPLLNSRIIIDLLAILKQVMEEAALSVEAALQCVLAALRLMQVAASVISVDESVFVTKLYALRNDLVEIRFQKFLPDFLECVEVGVAWRETSSCPSWSGKNSCTSESPPS